MRVKFQEVVKQKNVRDQEGGGSFELKDKVYIYPSLRNHLLFNMY